eukprot:15480611-Alexandrium_andersonii.AAC.1
MQGTRRSGYASFRSAHREQSQLISQTQLASRSELNSQIFDSKKTVARRAQIAGPNSQRLGPASSTRDTQYAEYAAS